MPSRTCKWCGDPIPDERHLLAEYCTKECRKTASRERNPYIPKPRKPRQCVVSNCAAKHYARGCCEPHYKNLLKYGSPDTSYRRAHAKVVAERGLASAHICECGATAKDWAYQHTARNGAEYYTDRGAPFSMSIEDYAPMCGTCHSRLDTATGRGHHGRKRQFDWLGKGNQHPIPEVWRLPDFRRWAAADGKRPIRADGRPASSTDPSTWHNWTNVTSSLHGDGVGLMLGEGIGCYDLDHVTDDEAQAFISAIPEPVYVVERSISGHGVHIFMEAPEEKGWRRVIDGISVERYTRARFIRVTGQVMKNIKPRHVAIAKRAPVW